jgi:hypothetical protein
MKEGAKKMERKRKVSYVAETQFLKMCQYSGMFKDYLTRKHVGEEIA